LTGADLKGITGKPRLDAINDRLQRQNELRGSLLQFFGGIAALFGVGFGAVTAWRQFQENTINNRKQHTLDRESQLTEQFTHAITYSNKQERASRVGGVYALDRFARTSEQEGDKESIYELLSTLVREYAKWEAPADTDTEPSGSSMEDVPSLRVGAPEVQAALTVLTDKRRLWPGVQPLDLPNTDLRKAILVEANLERSNLQGAHLEGANLKGANLQGAQLEGAHLDGAQFIQADLRGANLNYAKLHALIIGSDRQYVSFRDANLQGAQLKWVLEEPLGLGLGDVEWTNAKEDRQTTWPDNFDRESRERARILMVT